MDRLDHFREAIEKAMCEYSRIPYSVGEIDIETVFDRRRDHYLLMTVGWNRGRRVHDALIHIDVIDGKVWIQQDGSEHGIAKDLMAAGIPKKSIVLAFRPPELRKYTE